MYNSLKVSTRMKKLSLQLHGNFQVELDQRPIAGFGTNKTRALLAYLAVENGKKLKPRSYRSPVLARAGG